MKPKFKIGDLLLDDAYDQNGKQTDKLCIGEIEGIGEYENDDEEGTYTSIYYSINWYDGIGCNDTYDEDNVEDYRERFIEYSNKLKSESHGQSKI